MPVDHEAVLVEVEGAVATLTLHRPERLNALNGPMLDGLLDALRSFAADGSIRVVVLTGAGRGFCAGGDVSGLTGRAGAGGTDTTPSRSARATMEIDELLHGMPKPTIARINGPCAGAGLSMAAACDLRYAAASAVFATAFLRIGLSGDHGGIWSVTRAVGPARARELFLLGDRTDAAEAARIGLVHRTVPDPDLDGVVADVAGRLAAAPPHAVAGMKANLNDALLTGFGAYLDRETARFEEALVHPDTAKAVQAFIDRPR